MSGHAFDSLVCHLLICTFVRLRIACNLQLKFYGVRALGPVTPVKAKFYAYFCIVVVGGVLSRQYEMRQLLLVAHRKADSYLQSPSGWLLLEGVCASARVPPEMVKSCHL